MKKLAELEATAPKVSKKKMLSEDSTKPPVNAETKPTRFKDIFETMAMQKPIPVVGKQGDTQQTGAGFLNVTDTSPAAQALGNALSDLATQKKVQIVMPTQGQPAPAGATGQQPAGQLQMKEKDEGKPGKNFAKIAKSAGKRYGSKEAGERVAGAVRAKLAKQGKLEEEQLDEKFASQQQAKLMYATAGGADTGVSKKVAKEFIKKSHGQKVGKLPKKVKEADIPSTQGVDTMGAGLGAGRSQTTLENRSIGESAETEYRVLGTYDAKTSKGYDTRPVSVKVNASGEKEAKELAKEKLAHNHKNYKATKVEVLTKKVEEGKKPDFLDLDKDGNKKESMKKAAADKKKKKVDESMNHRISAARLEGKSHGLRGHAHSGKRYEDLEELKAYHEGYKEGLDECYGQGVYENAPAATVPGMASQAMPAMEDEMEEGIRDNLKKAALGAVVAGNLAAGGMMAKNAYDYHHKTDPHTQMTQADFDQAMGRGSSLHDPAARSAFDEGEMDEGNAFTAALAKTPKGGKFSVGGKTFTDRSSHDAKIDEYAFESLDKQLNALLNESEDLNEGLSVSVSKGQQNAPDSVTITAQDAEADQLLQLVKHAGLGLFGDDAEHEPSSAMSLQPASGEPNEIGTGGVDIDVVDGSDGMLSLMKKLGGVEAAGAEDYDDEEEGGCDCEEGNCDCDKEEANEGTCMECGGMMEAGHSCGSKEMVDEVETEDQMEFEVAEDNAPDSGAAETTADEEAEADEDKALALKSMNESFFDLLDRLDKLSEGSGDEPKHPEHDKKDDKDYDDAEEEDEEEDVTEGLNEWANQVGKGPGKGTDASFEQDIEFMTKVIAGGLNKPKSTGQTTIPVIAGQDERMHDNPQDWATLAGIKK